MFVLAKIVFFLFLIPQLLADDIYVPTTVAEKPPNVALEDSGENWKFVMKNGDVLDCYFILEKTEPVVHFKITRPNQIKNETYFNVFFNTKPFESIEFYHHYENFDVRTRIDRIELDHSQKINYEMFFNKNGRFGIRNGGKNGSSFALEVQNSNGYSYVPFKLVLTAKDAADFLEFFFKKGTIGFAQTLKPQTTTPPTEKADAALIGGIVGGVVVLIVVVAGGLGVYFYRRKQKKPSLEQDK
uniref:Uncharacterized protein n=1 Tax=Panagrolaimus sp. JU765 TaxID=591449 RepID=A0AC34R7J1_9BILA